MKADPPAHRAALGVILGFAVAIRILHLGQPMRYDEAWTFLHYSSRPLSVALSDYTLPNNHVFHTLLVWLTTRVFGDAPWAIRLPALVAGVLTVPATYLVGRRLAGRTGALFGAAIAAALPALILYSINARGYSIVVLAFLVLLLLGDALVREGSRGRWVLFALVAACGAYTAPFMLYPAAAIGLWIVLEKWRQGGRGAVVAMLPGLAAAFALAAAFTLVAYAPVIARSGLDPLTSNRFVAALSWPRLAAALPGFGGSLRDSLLLGIPGLLLVVLAVAAALSFADKTERPRRITLAVAVGGACLFLLLATRRPPPARVWLFLAPLGGVYAGIGLALVVRWLSPVLRIREEPFGSAAAVLLAVAIGVRSRTHHVIAESTETGVLADGPEIARFLLAELREGDAVVVAGPTGPPLEYYLRTLGGRGLPEFTPSPAPERLLVVVNASDRQTLDGVEAYWRQLPWQSYTPGAILRSFGKASVYQLRRRPLVSPPGT